MSEDERTAQDVDPPRELTAEEWQRHYFGAMSSLMALAGKWIRQPEPDPEVRDAALQFADELMVLVKTLMRERWSERGEP